MMNTQGYEKLADVLERAYEQAAAGKGKERHAQGEPFHEQVMQIGARKFGHGALLFQAFKKSEESQRLPHDRAVAELLGSIVYLAGAVIAMEASIEKKEPSVLAGAWIEWKGGACPVPHDVMVIYRMRDGEQFVDRAGDLNWDHQMPGLSSDCEIIAYRITGGRA